MSARHISALRSFPFSLDAFVIHHFGDDLANCYLGQPGRACFSPSCRRIHSRNPRAPVTWQIALRSALPTSTTTSSSPESIVGSHPRHNARRQPPTPKRARPTPAPSPTAALRPSRLMTSRPSRLMTPRPPPAPSPPALQLLLPSARPTLSRQNFQPRTTLPLTTYPLDLLRPTHEPTPFASDTCPTFRSQLSFVPALRRRFPSDFL